MVIYLLVTCSLEFACKFNNKFGKDKISGVFSCIPNQGYAKCYRYGIVWHKDRLTISSLFSPKANNIAQLFVSLHAITKNRNAII